MNRTRMTVQMSMIGAGLFLLLLSGCEKPGHDVEQIGYRGLAMEQLTNPRDREALIAANVVPEPGPPVPAGTPLSSETFQNVQVLGHLESAEFTRLMLGLTNWVSPGGGCLYCHDGSGFQKDSPYTKVVARRMIEMTLAINTEWKDHVGDTGVTCYTCHRGNPVPANYWHAPAGAPPVMGPVGGKAGQNAPSMDVALSSLPNDPFSAYLGSNADGVRIQSTDALPTGNRNSIKGAEWTYGFMMHISDSLGVNCTYCHNSRSMGLWEASTPARAQAWHGIQMVRDLNETYIGPLASVMPAERKGPHGDAFKVNCATCHQGANKPLLGVSMLDDYPVLGQPSPQQHSAVK